jgi:serine phosphatase RsbU (regulator of sigma subunit)
MEQAKLETLERMQCMEIWGGNRAIDKSFEAPGIDIYVHSTPFKESCLGGGDIYYLTSCASGRISRFLLADVSGHGEAASSLAVSLRDLLRRNVNRISQERFVEEMNNEFEKLADSSAFATAVVATFFEPKRTLSLCVAGHPSPIFYRAAEDKWIQLDPSELEEDLDNLPLGIRGDSSYPGRHITTEVNDMFLLYSDALIESLDADKRLLGTSGVLSLLNDAGRLLPSEVIPFLRERIGAMATGNLLEDDATMVLGHCTSTRVRMRDNLLAPFRLLSEASDNTEIAK